MLSGLLEPITITSSAEDAGWPQDPDIVAGCNHKPANELVAQKRRC